MLTLILALVLMILTGGAVEYEAVLRMDVGAYIVGQVFGRSIEVSAARYRPNKTFVQMRAW